LYLQYSCFAILMLHRSARCRYAGKTHSLNKQ
jgi:hypothetical protein